MDRLCGWVRMEGHGITWSTCSTHALSSPNRPSAPHRPTLHQTKPTTKVTGSKLPAFPISYDEYVRLSVVLQKGGPQVAKDAVLSVLRSIAFPVRLVPRGF